MRVEYGHKSICPCASVSLAGTLTSGQVFFLLGDYQVDNALISVEEGRDDLPIFIHSELDDLDITAEAFRVYAHLARRAGSNGKAYPSYQSIGERCFRKQYPNASSETLRRKAIAAVNELIELGLILKRPNIKKDGSHATNDYRLTPRREWKAGGSVNTPCSVMTPGVVSTHPGSVLTPKDSPLEGTPIEGTPSKRSRPSTAGPATGTKAIVDRYCQCLGYVPARSKMARVGADAKDIASRGYSPDEVEQVYNILNDDPYWQDKTITLPVILTRLEKTKLTIRSKEGALHDRTKPAQEPQGYTGGWTPELLEKARDAKARGDRETLSQIIRGGV